MLAHAIHGSDFYEAVVYHSYSFITLGILQNNLSLPWGHKNICELTFDFSLTFPQYNYLFKK